MKFTKTLVAVAIAGIAAAPMIASADTTLSGIVQLQVKGDDTDEVPGTPAQAAIPDDPATANIDESMDATEATEGTNGDIAVAAGDVRVNILSEHELNNGLTGYGNIRIDADGLSGVPLSSDNIYTGIKGGFGDVRIGEISPVVEFGQTANDIYDVADDINGGLSYTGDFGPVSLGLGFSPENNEDLVTAGVKFGLGGFAIGLGYEARSDEPGVADQTDRLAAGVSFTYAGAAIAAHFWSQEGDADDTESMSVKAGYGFGGVAAALTFSTLALGDDTEEAIRLDLGYDLGGGTEISTRVTSFSGDEIVTPEQVQYRIQLAKTF